MTQPPPFGPMPPSHQPPGSPSPGPSYPPAASAPTAPGPAAGPAQQPYPGRPGYSPPPRPPAIQRLQPVGGTPFAFGYVKVPPVTSGLAIGALIAGIASILVALGMVCLGLSGASDGWGALVA